MTQYDQCTIEVPSDFYVDLHIHHEKLIALFQQKIDEAESLASSLLDQAIHSEDNKPKQDSLKEMKYKIFDVCRLIYEEQREAGAQLQQIERAIEKLKVDFKEAMIKKRGYYGTYEDLDAMFEYSKTSSDHRIFTEVKQKIAEIKNRNVYNNLEG